MLYELREYVAVPGRLPALIERFNAHTIPLLAKHDMTLVHLGLTTIGERSFGEVVYMLAFSDLNEMDAKWGAFLTDPEWVAAEAASEADGPLIATLRRRILNPGAFTLTPHPA